jgi:hypothetical protein
LPSITGEISIEEPSDAMRIGAIVDLFSNLRNLYETRSNIMNRYNGLGASLGTLSELSHARSRSISPENFSGEKGAGSLATEGTGARAARELGVGWKISPSIIIQGGETRVLADIEGPGAITHIWMTPTGHFRHSILRIYWDDSELPSVECPVGDFFANGWGEFAQVNSLPVCVNPGSDYHTGRIAGCLVTLRGDRAQHQFVTG